MDTYLIGIFNLRMQIARGTLRTIAFVDLWHLFTYGDEVCSREEGSKHQIFRVLDFTGGRTNKSATRRMRNNYGRDTPETDMNSFKVQCFNYYFNGKSFQPRTDIFAISPYEGEKPLTSLTVFPLRFSKECNQVRSDMVIRGRRQLELCNVSHKQYIGLTNDEPREDV